MKTGRNIRLGAAMLALLGVAFLSDVSFAQKTKGKTRELTTKQMMKGLVQVNCAALGAALKEKEVNWDDISLKAALLNEAGYLLMDDGRCPDKDWAGAAKAIRDSSKQLLEAAAKKELEPVQQAFKTLTTEGCAACHKVHRQKPAS